MNIRRFQLLSCLGLAAIMLVWLDPEPTAAAMVGLVTAALLFAASCRPAWPRRGLAIGNLALIIGLSLLRIPPQPHLLAMYIGISLWCILLVLEIWQLPAQEEIGARLHRQRLTAGLSALLVLIPFWYGLRLANQGTVAGWLLGGLGLLVCFGAWLTIAVGRFRHGLMRPGFTLWLGLLLGGALFAATAVTQAPFGLGAWGEQMREWMAAQSAGPAAQSRMKRRAGSTALDLASVPEAAQADRTPRVFLVFDESVREQQLQKPFYLRRAAYDKFTGRRWAYADKSFDWFEDPNDGKKDGWIRLGDPVAARTVTHGVFIPRQASHEMLSLPNPIAVGVPVLMRGPNQSFLIPAREGQDVAYAVKSSWSTYRDVQAADPVVGSPGRQFLQLPATPVVDRLRQDARRLAAGRRSPPARIKAVLRYMRATYSYSATPAGKGSLERFVNDREPGHCTLHATVFAILLRSLNIPVRMASGYYGGRLDRAAGVYFFTNADRHAWTEVYFEGHGWVIIDATPARPRAAQTVADSGFGERVEEFSFLGAPRVSRSMDAAGGGFRFWSAGYRSQLAEQGWAGFVLALVLGLGFLLAWSVLQWRQRSAPATTARPASQALPDYYRAFCSTCAAAGVPKAPGQTPGEYLQQLKVRGLVDHRFDEMLDYLYATRYTGQSRAADREAAFLKLVKETGISDK